LVDNAVSDWLLNAKAFGVVSGGGGGGGGLDPPPPQADRRAIKAIELKDAMRRFKVPLLILLVVLQARES
jgi:hypothetical protein